MAEKIEIVVRRVGLHREETVELSVNQLKTDATVGKAVRSAVKRLDA